MASLIFKHPINRLKVVPLTSSLSRSRAIHFTSVGSFLIKKIYAPKGFLIETIVYKKKAKVDDIEDLFGDEMVSSSEHHHDLFAEPTTTTTVVDKKTTTTTKGSSTSSRRVSSNPFKRSALLNKQIGFMKPRLGSSPLETQPKIRSRTWLTMMQLAKDGEDMKNVVDLLPMLHAGSGGSGALPSLFAEEFVREWWFFFLLFF